MRRAARSLAAACAAAFTLGQPAQAAVVWSQPDFVQAGWIETTEILPVSDFQLAGPASITHFTVWMSDGGESQGGDGVANGQFSSFNGHLSWYVFADAAGTPGALIAAGNTLPTVTDTGLDSANGPPDDIFRVEADLGPPLLLPGAGTYWFGLREGDVGDATDGIAIRWHRTATAVGEDSWFFGDGVNFQNRFGPGVHDRAFVLEGFAGSVPEPAPAGLLAAGLLLLARACRRAARLDCRLLLRTPEPARCPTPSSSPSTATSAASCCPPWPTATA